jgi:hypothetical protein
MPHPSPTLLVELQGTAPVAAAEFQGLYSQLAGWQGTEHHDDGTHGAVTADTLAVAGAGTFGSVASTGAVSGTTVSASTALYERGRTTALGEWITVAFNAGNFNADTGSSWGVDSADQVAFEYTLIGKTMWVNFDIRSTDVTAAGPTQLQITIPGGFTVAKGTRGTYFYADAGGATTVGQCILTTSGTTINLFKMNAAAWTATAADDTSVLGQIWFRVN